MLQIAMLGARRTSCHAVNAFFTRSKLIWPISSLKNTKMSKNRILGKKCEGRGGGGMVNGLKFGCLILGHWNIA